MALASMGTGEILELQILQSGGEGNLAIRASVRPDLSLKDAHRLAEKLERDLLLAFPELARVTVHLEPAPDRIILRGCGGENPPGILE